MPVLTDKRTLLWVGPDPMPPNVAAAVAEQWEVLACPSAQAVPSRLSQAGLVLILPPPEYNHDPRWTSGLLDEIDRSGAVAVVLLPANLAETHQLAHRRGQFIIADVDAPPRELAARIDAAAALQPAIGSLRADLAAVRGFGPGVAQNFQQLEEEMRLAARLQRDFLPKALPQVGPIRFAALFRPASWVSGDFYDVFRLDETHIGFYVADVVGHSMPAALLTIFIKTALQAKRITGDTYEIIAPEAAIAQLNADICQQSLSFCQFVTAIYALVNTETLELRYARGGHPCPYLLRGDGTHQPLNATGALLGILPDETFQAGQVLLRPGDRVVMFSDGAEDALSSTAHPGPEGLLAELQRLRALPGEQLALQLTAEIDQRRPTNKHDDDITVLVMDVAG